MVNEDTSHKLFSLTRYCSKAQLSVYLEINRQTLDKQLNTHDWKVYQIRMIDKWYNDVNKMKTDFGKDIKSISIKDEIVTAVIEVSAKKLLIN